MIQFFRKYKYELLLFGLTQHLFSGIFLHDFILYTNTIWEINILLLGLTCIGLFMDRGRNENLLRFFIFLIVLAMPLGVRFLTDLPTFMIRVSLIYAVFFGIIFWEVLRFLIKPSYINTDIISASICGYLLLIEVSIFLIQYLYYKNPDSISNISTVNPAATYVDIVYFCTIIQTTIGFGDIAPSAPNTKLAVSFFGVVGQFYSIVLIGILLSKFTSRQA